jgi:hypothetical protein
MRWTGRVRARIQLFTNQIKPPESFTDTRSNLATGAFFTYPPLRDIIEKTRELTDKESIRPAPEGGIACFECPQQSCVRHSV